MGKTAFKCVLVIIVILIASITINYLITPISMISHSVSLDMSDLYNKTFISENAANKLIVESKYCHFISQDQNNVISDQLMNYEFKDGIIKINTNLNFIVLSSSSLFEIKEGTFFYA